MVGPYDKVRWRLMAHSSTWRLLAEYSTVEKMTRGQALMGAAVRFPHATHYTAQPVEAVAK